MNDGFIGLGVMGKKAVFNHGLRTEIIDHMDPQRAVSLRRFTRLLEREDVRLRFGSPRKLTSDAAIFDAFRCQWPEQEMIWGVSQDGSLVGVVNCALIAPAVMEIGLVIRSDLKRRGLGFWLMEVAKNRACGRQVDKLMGSILSENTAMRRLARKVGFVAVGNYGVSIDMEMVLQRDCL